MALNRAYFPTVTRGSPEPSGPDAIVEVNLLVRAIAGGVGGSAMDENMAWNAALSAASIAVGTAVHALYVRDGQVVRDSWSHASVDGCGRSGASVDTAARRDAVELRVDLSERIATDRLRVLIDALESVVPAHDATIFGNALAVAERGADAPDPTLTEAGGHLDAILRLPDGLDQFPLDSPRYALMQRMSSLREQVAINAPSAAALLLAACIPTDCAIACSSSTPTLAEFLLTAATALRTGDYREVDGVVLLAAMRGHLNVLDNLSDQLLAAAEQLRDEALDAPPDPLAFSKLLFRIPPYATAAMLICRWVTEFGVDRLGGLDGDALRQVVEQIRSDPARHGPTTAQSVWTNRATQAEEILVRAADGLARQYFYWTSNQLRETRDKVQAAIASGDHLGAEMLFVDGVLLNHWPKSYRGFFMGTADEPGVDPRHLFNELPRQKSRGS